MNATQVLINLDVISELFTKEKGWNRRTDSMAMSVKEVIYVRKCSFNSKFELQVWTGVPISSSITLHRPFRIIGFLNLNGVYKPKTESYEVNHQTGWETDLDEKCQHVISLMRGKQYVGAGYVTTEFGQQIRY
jgi:hypothetical protein